MNPEYNKKNWHMQGEWERDVTNGYKFSKIGLIKEIHIGWHGGGGLISVLRFNILVKVVMADTGFEGTYCAGLDELEEFSREAGFRDLDELKGIPVLCLLNSDAINACIDKVIPHYRLMKTFTSDRC